MFVSCVILTIQKALLHRLVYIAKLSEELHDKRDLGGKFKTRKVLEKDSVYILRKMGLKVTAELLRNICFLIGP